MAICDESSYVGFRQAALDAISGYEWSLDGTEDELATLVLHPFTSYEERPEARVYQAVQAIKQGNAAADSGDFDLACQRYSASLASMNVDVAALPAFHTEVANQAASEARIVERYVSSTVGSGLTIAVVTIAVLIIGAVFIAAHK